MSSSEQYRHTPLPLGSIRLLRLLPHGGNASCRVECQLSSCDLLDSKTAHPFDALSYVWGSEDTPHPILIDNREYRVGTNLHAALLQLRDGFLPRTVWIDAICIDQTNALEKGQQVQSMAKIYAKAARVVIWLGEAAESSDQALEAIRKSASPQSVGSAINIDKTTKQAILDLVARPWFQRIWVLQEAAAARHVLVKCGSAEIDGYAFGSGLGALEALYNRDPNLRGLVLPIAELIKDSVFRPRYDTIPIQADRFSLSIRPLAELSDLFHARMATVAVDKVYALLGMSLDDPTVMGLTADYNTSWATVFAKLITSSLSREVSVETWDTREVAVIRCKGRVLGEVSRINRSVVTWKDTIPDSRPRSFTAPVSSKPIQRGDLVCILEKATKPTIIRPHTDYSTIVRIAASSIGSCVRHVPWSGYQAPKIAFPDDFLLVWDWHPSRVPSEEYEDFRSSQGFPDQRTQSEKDLEMATRLWMMGRLLESAGQDAARDCLQRSVKIGHGALGGPGNDWKSAAAIWGSWGDLLTQERDGWVALPYAAAQGYEGVVWLIFQHGGPPAAQDRDRCMMAMTWAAKEGHEGIVRQLLQQGARPDATGRDGWTTPLLEAAERGHEGIVQLLLEHGAQLTVDGKRRTALICAADHGHERIVQQLIEKGAAVDEQERCRGSAALHAASFRGHEQVVRLLLEKGATIELKDRFGDTPLSRAAWNSQQAITRCLLEKGATPKATNDNGGTPLHTAAFNGYEEVVRLLLENGAMLEATDNNGCTPLHEAAMRGHEEVVRLLLEKGATAEVKDRNGRTPLHKAAMSGREEVVRLLLENGATSEVKDRQGRTPLSDAVKRGLKGIAQQLLAARAAAPKLEEETSPTPQLNVDRKRSKVVSRLLKPFGWLG